MKSMLKSLMSVAAAALALTSCSNDATEEVILNGGSKTLEVNATIEETRTVMAADHVNLEWAAGDQIHLYIGADATVANDIDPVAGGKITGVTYNENDKVYAYYSTAVKNHPSKGVKSVLLNIPSSQDQTEANVFAGQYMPMAASGTIQNGKVTLAFKPLACVLVFNVYGPAQNEKIKSIKFNTSVGCCGYDSNMCDLTVDPVQYKPYTTQSATVTLTEPAAIDAAKPTDTKIGKNQVYLVVAPVSYPAGSKFIVTTDAGSTYTFETKNGIDCSQNTACVVNLNLKNAPEMQPAIEVPTVGQQESTGGDLVIENIVFKNIATADGLVVEVYNDPALTQLGVDWLTIRDNNTELFTSGKLHYTLAANTGAERTAYIVIKCDGVQAVIAITQVANGVKVIKASLTLADIDAAVGSYNGQYNETTITAADGSVWTGFVAGNNTRLQLGWNTTPSKSAAKSYLLVPNAGKVIKTITFTPEASTSNNRVLVLLPEDFTYTGQTATEVKSAAYAYSASTVKGSTDPISIDLTGKDLKRFMIRAVGGAVYLTDITIEYAE